MTWTPAAIEAIPLASLRPYARNARTHSPDQVQRLAASIREYGWTVPVLVDAEGIIVAGHGRVQAAALLGMAAVPCIRVAHLTDAQRRAYVLADNRLAEDAGWDDDLLRAELSDLKLDGFNLELTGFDAGQLDSILGTLPADAADAPPADAFGGLTSMERASVPLRHWRASGLLVGDVLDFGCGKESHEFTRYDAFTMPDPAPLLRRFDVVMCNYVLNVQPAEHLIHQTCALLRSLVRDSGRALIACRSDLARTFTSRRGAQVAKSWDEWAAILRLFFVVTDADGKGFHGFNCTRREA